MNIRIRKLIPDLLEDYLSFFDNEKHGDNKDEHKCYCVCWSSDDHRHGIDQMSSAQKRRDLATLYINNGMIQGYLAYDGGNVVGWCNANHKPDCYNCVSWLRFMNNVDKTKPSSDEKIKSIFCFAVASSMKRKGIATKLLEYVCNDAAEAGYNFVEAYPKKQIKQYDNFEGPIDMYMKAGFYIHDELEEMLVVRKKLK